MIRSMPATAIAVLHGDQTGEELLREALRVLDPGVLGLQVETRDFDLSLEERRHTRNQCVLDAAEALRQLGFGIKAATITPEGAGDVGSPNAILRKQIDGRVIGRTGRRIPGVRPLAGVHAPISLIRMAVGASGAGMAAMAGCRVGTAPALESKNVTNPMAMIVSVTSLVGYMKGDDARRASRAIYETAL